MKPKFCIIIKYIKISNAKLIVKAKQSKYKLK